MTITEKVEKISYILRPVGYGVEVLYYSFQTDSVEFYFRVKDEEIVVSLSKENIDKYSVFDAVLAIRTSLLSKMMLLLKPFEGEDSE